ncbi:ribosome-binding factor A [Methylopila jiangsuensis]|uniref:Ribosome-binding factor A n=1 Tax=Methylopila jiangsuensis TaxID=586230 RepID=A0A9W6JKV4_9HYPH|nr:30S ribosome-binding factor RbfA [Methylopila jiangsuensis]MDR6285232.1 ribosome-binding factor A [Methylopila jiangsuensis]GLK77378.1 ribosome-binding factor A [Methylopila jiangsuensis]
MSRSSQGSKAPSQRMLRVGELVRHALAEVFQRGEVMDPVLEKHVITVPEVRMTPDLKLATAYVMPLGGKDVAKVLKALEANRKQIRMLVVQRLALKSAPDLRFREDESFAEGARIDALLRSPQVSRDLDEDAPEGDDR